MKNYDVWIEGYQATGNEACASFVGTYKATSFRKACLKAMQESGEIDDYYNAKDNTYWGCRFFDNEEDARMGFG